MSGISAVSRSVAHVLSRRCGRGALRRCAAHRTRPLAVRVWIPALAKDRGRSISGHAVERSHLRGAGLARTASRSLPRRSRRRPRKRMHRLPDQCTAPSSRPSICCVNESGTRRPARDRIVWRGLGQIGPSVGKQVRTRNQVAARRSVRLCLTLATRRSSPWGACAIASVDEEITHANGA